VHGRRGGLGGNRGGVWGTRRRASARREAATSIHGGIGTHRMSTRSNQPGVLQSALDCARD
jgi:hypothetical protein